MSRGQQPLQRVSTVEALVNALRERILTGELSPGARLPEVELSEDYGVGRYTGRAALQELVYRGMAEHAPHRGVSVLRPSPEVTRDLYAYRAGLECEAARLIVERDLPRDAVRDAVRRLEELPRDASWAELLEADLAVHEAIVNVVGSSRMRSAFASIADQVMLCLSTLDGPRAGVVTEHQALLHALESGDLDAAAREVRAHLYDVLDQLSAREPTVTALAGRGRRA